MRTIATMSLAAALLTAGAAWAASTERDAEHQFQTPDKLSWQPAPPVLPPGAEIAVLQGELIATVFAAQNNDFLFTMSTP